MVFQKWGEKFRKMRENKAQLKKMRFKFRNRFAEKIIKIPVENMQPWFKTVEIFLMPVSPFIWKSVERKVRTLDRQLLDKDSYGNFLLCDLNDRKWLPVFIQSIVAVSIGKAHIVSLNSEGEVFTLGKIPKHQVIAAGVCSVVDPIFGQIQI